MARQVFLFDLNNINAEYCQNAWQCKLLHNFLQMIIFHVACRNDLECDEDQISSERQLHQAMYLIT